MAQGRRTALLPWLALLCLWVPLTHCQMTWKTVDNSSALCNDFTRAGYFTRLNQSSNDWVIFLESGSLCFSAETCNRRFFVSAIRQMEPYQDPDLDVPPFGSFDPVSAYSDLQDGQTPVNRIVNPLMSSVRCYADREDIFESGEIVVEGRDILSQDPTTNPRFSSYNLVLIPYCSSDVWLGEETDGSELNCTDYYSSGFDPASERLQFTFRGRTIFQSVIGELSALGLDSADQVLLSGSSAGGLGAVNNALWFSKQLSSSSTLRVMFDSSYFINFQGNIFRLFDGTTSQAQSDANSDPRLLDLVTNDPACSNTSLGYPCCVSAHCVMTLRDDDGNLLYYPEDVPTLGIFGLYDVFLLAPALQGLAAVNDAGSGTIGVALDFIRIVSEYGGAMNTTLEATINGASFFSSYVTQCFQHIYLATSTLIGSEESSLLGNSGVAFTQSVASFSHVIQPGIWNSRPLSGPPSRSNLHIQAAIERWMTNASATDPVHFTDLTCAGPYCNEQCPEQFTLGEITTNDFPLYAKIIVAMLIVGLAVACLVMKLVFHLWIVHLEHKYGLFLDKLREGDSLDRLQFPQCSDAKAISVSCLDLRYSITIGKKKLKDENKDRSTPLVLSELTNADSSEDEEDMELNRSRAKFRTRRTAQFGKTFRETVNVVRRRSTKFVPPPLDEENPLSSSQSKERSSSYSATTPTTPTTPTPTDDKRAFGRQKKEILKGISIYFNPGELIGIMGPSGCGKTTFLDLLTGRRKTGTISGDIYVNGVPMEEIKDWYIANTGYVLQLATPYYEELTVRENLTLAAKLRLAKNFDKRENAEDDELKFDDDDNEGAGRERGKLSHLDKIFERIEQVMQVTGLFTLADTVVGGSTGPGLSGGQKRRLVIALQLLKLPSVIFLDEPTSGLDSTSSFELLTHLNTLADSNRTVILTIHQPRLEIFHMFTRLILLVDGRVSYHGVPDRAYEVFVNALTSRYLEQGLIIPSLEDHNPADVIMDMLGNPKMRQIITDYYQQSSEPRLVQRAIKAVRWKEYSQSTSSMDSLGSTFSYAIFGARRAGKRHAGPFDRLAVLEARAAKRATNASAFYLPIFFFGYGFLLGTVYLQVTEPLLIVSGFCVYSVASALFMFPALYLYYEPALRVYGYERGDGIGRAHDLIIQGFIRFITLAAIPVVVCAGVLYLLLVDRRAYDAADFFQVVLVNLALNQTWTALLIALICALPAKAFRISPVVSSLAGFTSGFFIPINNIPWWYRWMTYINPNYYGFSASAFFLLEDYSDPTCNDSQIACFTASGPYILEQFNFNTINPYVHILVLLLFTLFFLALAIFSNWVRHTSVISKVKRLKVIVRRLKKDDSHVEEELGHTKHECEEKYSSMSRDAGYRISIDELEKEPKPNAHSPPPSYSEDTESAKTPLTGGDSSKDGDGKPKKSNLKWHNAAEKFMQQSQDAEQETQFGGANGDGTKQPKLVRLQDDRPQTLGIAAPVVGNGRSLYLREGEAHQVWRPKKKNMFASLVSEVLKQQSVEGEGEEGGEQKKDEEAEEERESSVPATTPGGTRTQNLWQRQKTLLKRVKATQEVLKEQSEELANEEHGLAQHKEHVSLLEASKRITSNIKKQRSGDDHAENVSSVVAKFLSALQTAGETGGGAKDTNGATSEAERPKPAGRGGLGSRKKTLHKKASSSGFGVIPLEKWKDFKREQRQQTQSALKGIPEVSEDGGVVPSPTKKRTGVTFADLHDVSPVVVKQPLTLKDSLEGSTSSQRRSSSGVTRASFQRQDPFDKPQSFESVSTPSPLVAENRKKKVTSTGGSTDSEPSPKTAAATKAGRLSDFEVTLIGDSNSKRHPAPPPKRDAETSDVVAASSPFFGGGEGPLFQQSTTPTSSSGSSTPFAKMPSAPEIFISQSSKDDTPKSSSGSSFSFSDT